MADTKISGLTAATALTTDDLLPLVDDPGGVPTTKKITWANVLATLNAVVAAGVAETRVGYGKGANTLALTGDSQFTRNATTHETTIAITTGVGVTARFFEGTLALPGGLNLAGAFTVGEDVATGDFGFSGSADLTAFGLSKEAGVIGHIEAGGDTFIAIVDQIGGKPTMQIFSYPAGGLAAAISVVIDSSGVAISKLGSGNSLTFDGTTGTTIAGPFVVDAAEGVAVGATPGFDGTFDGTDLATKTVTVSHGIITDVS